MARRAMAILGYALATVNGNNLVIPLGYAKVQLTYEALNTYVYNYMIDLLTFSYNIY